MNLYFKIDKRAKGAFYLSVLLILYACLCRLTGIYFFWESLAVGFFLMLISILFAFIGLSRMRKRDTGKYGWELVPVVLISFLLLVMACCYIILPTTDAYQAAKAFLIKDNTIRAEIGPIRGFSLCSPGHITMSSGDRGVSGEATFELIVKGEKKYKDLWIFAFKRLDTDWQVTILP